MAKHDLKSPRVSKITLTLLFIVWFIAKAAVLVLCILIISKGSSGIGLFFAPVVWQAMTEIGYYCAYYLGYHALPEGTIYRGVSSPVFISNDDKYINDRKKMTRSENVLRLIWALSDAFMLGFIGIMGSLFVQITLENKDVPLFLFSLFFLLFVLMSFHHHSQKWFAKIFGLKIAWRENRRPFFKKVTQQSDDDRPDSPQPPIRYHF